MYTFILDVYENFPNTVLETEKKRESIREDSWPPDQESNPGASKCEPERAAFKYCKVIDNIDICVCAIRITGALYFVHRLKLSEG